MSSRSSHVDVNERRLRPIYDNLDSGNNKKAIQEADRLLKKQKDFSCARVLRALALIRLGRHDETTSTLHEVHLQHPSDEHTLQAMAMCYRDLNRLDLLANMYENAHKAKPDSEEILNSLFMAYVRLGFYQKQQQVAMLLHKLRPQKNPYYFWAVMSIVMQAHTDQKLGRTMYLPLAEKMTLKYIQEGKLEAEAEVRLYLIILQCLDKHKETLEVLHGPLAAKLTSEPDFVKLLEGEMYKKLEKWPELNALYKELLKAEPDQWQFYKEYLSSVFQLVSCGWSPDSTDTCVGPVDYTVDMAVEFITSLSSTSHQLRGPLLAQLELMRLLRQRQDQRWDTVFACSPWDLVKKYLTIFGDKPCCYSDLHLFVDLFESSHLCQLLTDELNQLALGSVVNNSSSSCAGDDNEQFICANDPKLIQRHISLLQLLRCCGQHKALSMEDKLKLIASLHRHYIGGLHLGETLLSTDLQYVDSYMLLIVHLLYDLYTETGSEDMLWHAGELLEKAIARSPANFQLKILLIQIYSRLGAVYACFSVYEKMEVKHIQHDSLGYLVSCHALRFGHMTKADALFETMLRFFATVQKDTSDYLISSYKYGSFPKVHEFVQFKERLLHSLQFASATAEKLLLDIVRTNSHKLTQEIVINMDVDPLAEKTDFDAVRDNRDCQVMQAWDTTDRSFTETLKLQSFTEEKHWLQLRNLIVRSLVASGRVASDSCIHPSATSSGSDTVVDGLKNGGDPSTTKLAAAMEAVNQLKAELKLVLGELSAQYSSCDITKQVVLLVGPFRTRLTPYLRLGIGNHLVELLDFLAHLGTIRDDFLADKDHVAASVELPTTTNISFISERITDSVKQLFAVDATQRASNIDTIENLVLVVEHICHVAVVMGACHSLLKPVKLSGGRRNKKKRELDPQLLSLCETYSNQVNEVTNLSKKLLAVFEEIGASTTDCVVTAFKSLAFNDQNSTFQALSFNSNTTSCSDDFESIVADKLRLSLQQTSAEMTSLLKSKLQYMDALHI